MTVLKRRKSTGGSQAEQLIGLLLTDRTIPDADMEEIRRWLVDKDRANEKAEAFIREFAERITYSRHPRKSCRLWPALAQRLGIGSGYGGIPARCPIRSFRLKVTASRSIFIAGLCRSKRTAVDIVG